MESGLQLSVTGVLGFRTSYQVSNLKKYNLEVPPNFGHFQLKDNLLF